MNAEHGAYRDQYVCDEGGSPCRWPAGVLHVTVGPLEVTGERAGVLLSTRTARASDQQAPQINRVLYVLERTSRGWAVVERRTVALS